MKIKFYKFFLYVEPRFNLYVYFYIKVCEWLTKLERGGKSERKGRDLKRGGK